MITNKLTIAAMEEILGTPYSILDHGFIRVIDYMGGDESIVQAARVSYGRGTKQVNQDQGLINYLMRHSHTTPFEMCELKVHLKMPIFVARQWVRHRTASINEYSARYSILDKEFYLPTTIEAQSNYNAQGRGEELNREISEQVTSQMQDDSRNCYQHYEEFLNAGVAREIARANLPINYYTQMYWKIDLHNLFHFLKLRADAHAQYEIRKYAECLLSIVEKWVPMAYKAFLEYNFNSYKLSATGLSLIKGLLSGAKLSLEESGMSKREYEEFVIKLGINSGN